MNIYFVCIILSALLTAIHIFGWQNRFGITFSLMSLFATIANLGYWQVYEATQLNEAILATKIAYLGSCFAILSMMLCIFNLCKIKISANTKSFFYLCTLVVYCSCLSVGYTDIFYKNISLELISGRYVLIKEYGPWHHVFYAMLYIYLGLSAIALLVGLRRRKEVSASCSALMFSIMAVNIFSHLLDSLFFERPILPLGYVISEVLVLIATRRLVLYDTNDMLTSTLMKEGKTGVASFDFQGRFLGCNDVARKFCPQLAALKVDGKIPADNDDMHALRAWIDRMAKREGVETIYPVGDLYCKVSGTYLHDQKKDRGYTFIFSDFTKEKQHQEELMRISLTDGLTGLNNRRAYKEDIESIKYPLVIANFDLNGLKRANDTLGHAAGDELLRATAECLNEAFGRVGQVYRTGGDEFAVILSCEEQELERILADFDERVACWRGELVSELTISRGVAAQFEFPDYTVFQLEKEADRRMYADKERYYERAGVPRRQVGE